MATKPPSSVRPAQSECLEKTAYESVSNVPTIDPHDQDRLGYNVWRLLALKRDSLEVVVRTAGPRLLISEDEAAKRIRENLLKHGIQV